MIDLDGFKRINDCFGHAQGDEALSETANVLRRCLHANDFIARYAGDEFVVIADIHRPEDATTLCSRIEESFESYNRESGKQWRLCASMGTAICDPGSLQCPGKLIEEADKKMYQDKACGRHATVPPSVLTISS
jgi:diguanylate cyclase (GGDEF)-like protein